METRLKEIRKKAGFTQEQAAKTFTVSLGTYRNWEQGRVIMNAAQLIDAAKRFNATVDYILMLDSSPQPNTLTPYERELIAAARACDNTRKQSLLIAAKDAAMCSRSVATGGGGGYSKKKHYSVKFKVYAGGVRSKQVIRYAALKKTRTGM